MGNGVQAVPALVRFRSLVTHPGSAGSRSNLISVAVGRFMRNAKRYAERPCLRSSTQLGNELLYDAQRFPYRALNPNPSREIPMGAYQTGAA